MEAEHLLAELIDTARRVGSLGLVVNSSGNISVRLDRNTFAISSSGSCLHRLDREQICICRLDREDGYDGPVPSAETHFHRSIYSCRSDVNAILHFQSRYATAMACAESVSLDLAFIPEIPVYVKNIGTVPFVLPGTKELALAVAQSIADPDCGLLVLKNHGAVAVGPSLASMLRKAEFFEFACSVAFSGLKLRTYDEDTRNALKDYGRE